MKCIITGTKPDQTPATACQFAHQFKAEPQGDIIILKWKILYTQKKRVKHVFNHII
jgi:hypothetical protein